MKRSFMSESSLWEWMDCMLSSVSARRENIFSSMPQGHMCLCFPLEVKVRIILIAVHIMILNSHGMSVSCVYVCVRGGGRGI